MSEAGVRLRTGALLFHDSRGQSQIRFGNRIFIAPGRLDVTRLPDSLAAGLADLGLLVAGDDRSVGERASARVGVVGTGRLYEIAARIAPAIGVTVVELGESTTAVDASRGAIDALLACFDSLRPDIFGRLNRWSVETGVSWLPLYLETTGPVVGPFTDPFNTACWACARLRREAATTRLQELEDYWAFLDAQPDTYAVPHESSTGDLVAATALALADCVAWHEGGSPRSAGYLVEVLPERQPFAMHPVLPVPSCPVCGDDVRDGQLPLQN